MDLAAVVPVMTLNSPDRETTLASPSAGERGHQEAGDDVDQFDKSSLSSAQSPSRRGSEQSGYSSSPLFASPSEAISRMRRRRVMTVSAEVNAPSSVAGCPPRA